MKRRPRPAGAPAPARAAPVVPPPRSEWIALALVLAAGAAIHLAALRKPFFADDYLFLDQVRHHSLPAVLAGPDPLGNFFRPVGRQAYFWTVSRIGAESPVVFHVLNVALFLLAIALVHAVARRLAGPRAAIVAAAFVALQYAADVPVWWASGSQDLLAVCGGTAAILLYVAGRRWWAAWVFLAALLSKETVLFTPAIAAWAGARERESWRASLRRAWPLFAVWIPWGAAWLVVRSARPGARAGLDRDPLGALAAIWHLGQVALGLELRKDRPLGLFGHPLELIAVALAAGAVAWLFAGRNRRPQAPKVVPSRAPSPGRWRRAALVGAIWALLASLPVAAAGSLWSAYYYLFALCGVGLALGALLARAPATGAFAAVLALGLLSANARSLDEFATARGPWTALSHVNRFYLERAMQRVKRHLAELKRARPTVPARSTLFFARFPSFIGWQAGDGPLARWAYRDSSLRSYYFSAFSAEKARRGPYFFFVVDNDTLHEVTGAPNLIGSIGWAMILEDKKRSAEETLRFALDSGTTSAAFVYVLAWTELDLGDTATALRLLRQTGADWRAGPAPAFSEAEAELAAGDTVRAVRLLSETLPRYILDPRVHARLSDVLLAIQPGPTPSQTAMIEAYVATVLDPRNPSSWKRWAWVQTTRSMYEEARQSLDRFYALGGDAAARDPEAARLAALLERLLPGGDITQSGLRR